ncbi:DNA polymerase III subunit delta [Puteibacter caeruleilacunae]|nr:DNA polymerase III subunit delta [Puteibacter caeruleilacunae]
MTYEQIFANLRSKKYHPIYFLMGEESYFIDQITDFLHQNVLTEAEKGFNETVLYGRDTDIDTIITTARRFPMMASHQLVVIKEAQNIKNIEDLCSYAAHPLNSTILVVNYKYKTLDKRKKLAKLIQKNGVLFESKKIYENQIPNWISSYMKTTGHSITPQAGLLLAEYLGTDLSKITNELDKLIISLKEPSTIKPEDIERNIGISKDFNIFELQNALAERDILKANRIINYFGANSSQNPIQKTTSSLYFYFAKLLKFHFLKNKANNAVASELQINPYFVEAYKKAAKNYTPKKLVQIIGILREYDMKSKGLGNVSANSGELQKEMIFKILH